MKLNEQRMMEIAGIDPKLVQEQRTNEENAQAQALIRAYGPLGQVIVNLTQTFVETMEWDSGGIKDPESLTSEDIAGIITDHIEDLLGDVLAGYEFRKFAEQQVGKVRQIIADPDQSTLEV
jgi:hypothetical protein